MQRYHGRCRNRLELTLSPYSDRAGSEFGADTKKHTNSRT